MADFASAWAGVHLEMLSHASPTEGTGIHGCGIEQQEEAAQEGRVGTTSATANRQEMQQQ